MFKATNHVKHGWHETSSKSTTRVLLPCDAFLKTKIIFCNKQCRRQGNNPPMMHERLPTKACETMCKRVRSLTTHWTVGMPSRCLSCNRTILPYLCLSKDSLQHSTARTLKRLKQLVFRHILGCANIEIDGFQILASWKVVNACAVICAFQSKTSPS